MLKATREELKLSQKDLAKRLKRPQSYITKVESGQVMLDVIQLSLYVTELDHAPADFVKRYFKKATESIHVLKRARDLSRTLLEND